MEVKGEKEKEEIKNFLFENVKPVRTISEKRKDHELKVETLEEIFHGICIRYGYKHQGIQEYYEIECKEYDKHVKFIFYHVSLIHIDETEKKWIGNVYGKSLWEVMAKMIIKIYGHIKGRA